MTTKVTIASLVLIAFWLASIWYPINYLSGMQLGSTQLVFFAFIVSALASMPWLFLQVRQWVTHSKALILISLGGGLANTMLHLAVLNGELIAVLPAFSVVLVSLWLLNQVFFSPSYEVSPSLILVGLILLYGIVIRIWFGPGGVQPNEMLAGLAGVGFYLSLKLSAQEGKRIPLISKVSAILVCSTWFVGMIIIFSAHTSSFPQQYAVTLSGLYGLACLLPSVFLVCWLAVNYQAKHLVFCYSLLLAFHLLGLIFLDKINPSLVSGIGVLLLLLLGLWQLRELSRRNPSHL